MPTTLPNGVVVPSSDLEPADMFGVVTRLGESVDDALGEIDAATQHVVKGSDQTYSANVLTDDTALLFTVAASGVYVVEGVIFHLCSTTTAPFKFSYSLPSGTFSGAHLVFENATSSVYEGYAAPGTASNTEQTVGLSHTATIPLQIRHRIEVGGTGGTVHMRFKDDTDGDTLTVKAGSWFTARKVA